MVEIIIAVELFVLLFIAFWAMDKVRDALALLQTISQRAQLVKDAIMYVHKNERLFMERLLSGEDAEPVEVPEFVKKVREAYGNRNLN
jgi:hypothetical protein